MTLSAVRVTPEVFLACTTQALTDESEEVMGLLLGAVKVEGGQHVTHIWKAVPQIRTDRRKDRVESSPEQVADCTALAERLTAATGVATRVVGWYHSHPHITVLPSHVDVDTQALYQMMDPHFVGLIWSVFNNDRAGGQVQQVQVTAFQSVPASSRELDELSSADMEGLDAQMKAALRTSAAEHSRGTKDSWVRREVPLSIEGQPALSGNPSPLSDLVSVQSMLMQEEQLHFPPSTSTSGQQDGTDPAAAAAAAVSELHAAAARQQGLAELLETQLGPAVLMLGALRRQLGVQRQQLLQEQEALKAATGGAGGQLAAAQLDALCSAVGSQSLLGS